MNVALCRSAASLVELDAPFSTTSKQYYVPLPVPRNQKFMPCVPLQSCPT